jgi:hypothetical protein
VTLVAVGAIKVVILTTILSLFGLECEAPGFPLQASYDLRNQSEFKFAAAHIAPDGSFSSWLAVAPKTTVSGYSWHLEAGDAPGGIGLFDASCQEVFRAAIEPGIWLIVIGEDGGSFRVDPATEQDTSSATDRLADHRESCAHAFSGIWAANRGTQPVVLRLTTANDPAQAVDYLIDFSLEAGWVQSERTTASPGSFEVLSRECKSIASGDLSSGIVGILIEGDGHVTVWDDISPAVEGFYGSVPMGERCP